MAKKQSKRSRKFEAKGGAKGMLEKGTITKKGKLKRKRRGGSGGGGRDRDDDAAADAASARREEEERKKRDDDDFAGSETNLGDLDLDGFFRSVAEEEGEVSDEDEETSDGEDDASDEEEEDSDGDGSVGSSSGSSSSGGGSGDDDGDDEEDVEAAERRMKREMEKLESDDPEFHKFLSENERSLLKFGEEEDDGEDDEEEDGGEAAEAARGGEYGGSEDEGEDADAATKEDDATTKKDNEESPNKNRPTKGDSPYIRLTPELLESYERGAFRSHGLRALKRIVSAYRSACHLGDAAERTDKKGRAVEIKGRKSYEIDSGAVFDRLMVVCLQKCHGEFRYHLLEGHDDSAAAGTKGKGEAGPSKAKAKAEDAEGAEDEAASSFDENKPLSPKTLAKSRRWTTLKPILQSFLKSTLHVLSEAKEPALLSFVLKALSKYVPYLTPFPRIAKAYLKTFASLWSAVHDSSPEYQVARLEAFLRIRQIAITQPYPFIEQCLRSTYLAYAKRAKFGTAAAVSNLLPTLTFMGNCVVELYMLDYHSSYQHAFVYIRQLALHLRSALQKRTEESLRAVYCWQYVHCLKLWVAVLSSACAPPPPSNREGGVDDDGGGGPGGGGGGHAEADLLKSLVFPLAEIILGTARLVPTAQYVPLRLHCASLLQRLAASFERYIPTTSILLEILDLKEVRAKPKRPGGRDRRGGSGKSDVRGVRLPLILKLPKADALRTSEQLEACLGETFVLLNREVDLYRYSPGLPEFTVRICQRLRKFSKETKNGRWRAYARGCIELCERHSRAAIAARSNLNEPPKDVKRLEALKPPGAPSMRERYESAMAKERRLEAASRPVLSEAAKAEGGGDNRASRGETEEEAEEDVREKLTKKRRKKKKKEPPTVDESDLKNTGALEEEDEVEEGIHWSDEGSGGGAASDEEMDEDD